MTISGIIKQIIEKHIEAIVYVIWQGNDKINFDFGVLKQVSSSSITINAIDRVNETTQKKTIAFDDMQNSRILHIYNKFHIDLIKAKEVIPLSKKLRNSQLKPLIIKNLKPYLNKDLNIIYKTRDHVIIVKGRFTDMGIMGLTLMVAPFYNNQHNVPYDQIFNIYAEKVDLIDIQAA